jgi:DNA-binding FadR family transcriptional regulator
VALAKAAKNEILHVFMVAVKELHNRLLDKTDIPDDLYPTAISFHRKIFEAVKVGDSQQAANIMAEHLDYFGGHFQDLDMADIQAQPVDRSKL